MAGWATRAVLTARPGSGHAGSGAGFDTAVLSEQDAIVR